MTTDLTEDLDRVAALTKGHDLQWPYVSEVALKASATLKELEAKLASADAMIEAQAKDHASNNIRFAEATHRAEVAEAEVTRLQAQVRFLERKVVT